MTIAELLPLMSALSMFFLGMFVFFGAKNKLGKIFVFWSLLTVVWLTASFLMFASSGGDSALFFDRIGYIAIPFLPVTMYHIGLAVAKRKDNFILIAGYLLATFFAIISQTPYMLMGVYNYDWGFHGKAQIAHHFFLLFFFIYLAIFYYDLFSFYKAAQGTDKEKARYIFYGFFILTGSAGAFASAYGINIYPITFLFVLLGSMVIAYAILRYRFMDISFVVGRGFIYASTYLTIIGAAFLLVFAHNYFGYTISPLYLWPALLVLGIICYQPLFAFYERIAEKYFYYTYHSYQKALSELGRKANRFLELDKLSALLLDTICEIMHLEKAAIAIKNEKGVMAVISSRGFEKNKLQYFLKGDFLETYLSECLKPVSADDIPELTVSAVNNDYEKHRFHDLGQEMKKAEVNLCLPLAVEDKLSGVILLGNKNISDQFSEQDISLLGALSLHASIALQNAQYYSRIKSFGVRLENSVRQKTAELREANERLKQLDKAKSEFISIASHQLRAPLTIIKGYLAVIRDGDYGKAPTDAQARLATAYKANEQLIGFTNDLLDMSRLENGKTVLKSEEVDLGALVAGVILHLTPEAEKNGITLSLEKPQEKILVKGDRQACEQAIYNVVANSMAHTPRGKIAIKFGKEKNMHKVMVSDNGEGFSREDLKNIFNKQPPANSEGIGLSLVSGIAMYLAKKMVEMQKGKIKAESEGLGQGATITIEMPVS